MEAVDSVAPSEEVVLMVLGKDIPRSKATQRYTQEQSLDDPEATLPWGQSCQGSIIYEPETLEADPRPSPEGSREDASVGFIVDKEAFPKSPATAREEEEEEEMMNVMPEVAAHAFVPIDPCCIQRTLAGNEKQQQLEYEEEIVHCEKKNDPEKQNFIGSGYLAHFDDVPSYDEERSMTCAERLGCVHCRKCSSANLKATASMIGATIIFPCLLYGGYVFLPFDAPSMPSMSTRLVYTLRCGVFATFPIILGMVVYGVSRLCFSSLQPFGELRREVEIHRHYVSQSVHLFILYFFNITVLATYLPQEALKLIPLLTALFAISRLLYWLAYAMGRSFRAFGYGLTFLPLIAMLLFNFYSMFIMDPETMFAIADSSVDAPLEKGKQLAASKPRYWG